ncbi:MAG: low molecular weight protein arginine phosphatase [Thermanaerothrix sp.]|nr:low molecular weight protein arginine phosphatase [Thermanaerothrix sp.]
MGRVLFVCTGNTCRSPMAEAFLRVVAGGVVEVSSAGLFTTRGLRASPLAMDAAREFGVDLSDHRSTPLRLEALTMDTVVVCMARSHVEVLLRSGCGDMCGLISLFGDLVGHPGVEVPDPFGFGVEEYRKVAAILWDWSTLLSLSRPWEALGT